MTNYHISVDVDFLRGTGEAFGDVVNTLRSLTCVPSLFVAGMMAAEVAPELSRAARAGCEIGAHGWAHCEDADEDFRTLSLPQQCTLLERASSRLAEVVGERPIAFRAPNLWLGERTVEALAHTGFTIDSSVPSGRVDILSGRIRTTRFLRAPRQPYQLSTSKLTRRGASGVTEVPLVSAIVPINMMALRAFGVRPLVMLSRLIAARSGYVIFYCHPAEFAQRDQFDAHAVPLRHRVRVGRSNLKLLADYVRGLQDASLRQASLAELAARAPTVEMA